VTRDQALAAGLAIVDEIAPRTNARGYSDGTIKPGERVTLALQIADWLLAGEPGPVVVPIRDGFKPVDFCPLPDCYCDGRPHA
jgi:hypothetical protein